MTSRLCKEKIIPYIKEFETLSSVFYLVFTIVSYLYTIAFFEVYDSGFSILYKTYVYLFLPVMVYPFVSISNHYLFSYNWFRVIYLTVATAVYLITLSVISTKIYPVRHADFLNAGGFTLVVTVVGVAVGIIAAFPMKVVNYVLFNPSSFYYDNDINDIKNEIEEKGTISNNLKVQKKESNKVVSKKQMLEISTMNETELQIALKNAIADDAFELAEVIKKALEKYR